MKMALAFNDVQFDVIPQNSQLWIRSPQIAETLGYGQANRINDLYTRHADEFSPAMTAVVTLPTDGGPQETRIFSLRGCHLLAMFARTPIAKAFRRWVLDIIDKLAKAERATLSADVKPLSTAASRAPLRSLVHAWAQVSGISHTALWPQVRAHFQLTRIDDLPESWLADALAFVQEKIDQCARALPPTPPVDELAPVPAPAQKPESSLIYRDGKFYPPHKNKKHVAGPREKAIIDFWRFEYPRLEKELEERFQKLLAGIDKAAGDICSQAVAALGREADTMFSISYLLEGLHCAGDSARDAFKDALRLARLHMRMATSIATALNR